MSNFAFGLRLLFPRYTKEEIISPVLLTGKKKNKHGNEILSELRNAAD